MSEQTRRRTVRGWGGRVSYLARLAAVGLALALGEKKTKTIVLMWKNVVELLKILATRFRIYTIMNIWTRH